MNSNESPEIITFLNDAFRAFAKNGDLDLNPKDEGIQSEMTKWNDIIYPALNDGVYRCGFAKSQEAYDDAVVKLFECLDRMEKHLATNRYLCGDVFTLSDVRAWVTLLRFDPVYFTHFKVECDAAISVFQCSANLEMILFFGLNVNTEHSAIWE